MDESRLVLGLYGLWERVRAADPASAETPVRDIAFGDKWLVVRLANGACGRAFAFTGAHAVYGPFDLDVFRRMEGFAGTAAGEVVERALSAWGAVELGEVMAPCVAVAAMNAVSFGLAAPEALEARGFELTDDCVGRTVRPGDRVLVVGAGMFLDELRACRLNSLDVVDLRPLCDLASVRVGADGVRVGPEGLTFHTGTRDTPGLLEAADVVFLTGCTLVNGTFFDLMALPRKAREVVLFGPTAGLPAEALAELGVTCIATSVVTDAQSFVDGLLGDAPPHTAPHSSMRSYTVHGLHVNRSIR